MSNLILQIIQILGNIIQFIEPFYKDYGYLIVFFSAILEHSPILGFFMPGGATIALAGFYSSQGDLSLPWVLILAWLGFNAGENLGYWLGRVAGNKIVNRFKWSKKIEPLKEALNKHAKKTIILSHIVSPTRALVMLAAGMAKIPYITFLWLNLLITIPLTFLFVYLGYFLGQNRALLELYLKRIATAQWGIILILILIYLIYRINKSIRQKAIKNL